MLNIQQKKMLGLSAFALLFSVLFKEKMFPVPSAAVGRLSKRET